jgi:IS4 transposase
MSVHPLFESFLQKKPVCVMARAALERILDPTALDHLFEQTAQQQYTRDLLFSSLVDLMCQVVLGIQPSVHAAYQEQAEHLGVSDQAVYDKLQHVEVAVSAALVHYSGQRVRTVIDALGARLPAWLRGYRVKIVDGNHLAATQHRLPELRTTWAAPLPGKCLVVLEPHLMTVTHVLLSEDGQAQERSLLPDVLPLAQARDLWIGDRNLATCAFMAGLAARQAFFILRQHGQLQGELVGKRKAKGRCATGYVFEQTLQLHRPDGSVMALRRITVELDQPTREGDTEIHLLTNLPPRDASAATVAELYRRRWTIEGLFLEVTQTLDCEIDTLCYPKAALFAFCLGLLASNAVALLKAGLRAAQGRPKVEALSAYYLTLEIRQTYAGMMVALPAEQWRGYGTMSDADFARELKRMAGRVVLQRYGKHPRGPKKKPPARKRYKNGEHVATFKVLAARKSHK